MIDPNVAADYYYTHDHLFSPVALMEDDGTVVERYEYDAYGKQTIWDGSFSSQRAISLYHNPISFTGQRFDMLDNGVKPLGYFKGRYYDPITGRMYTPDRTGYGDGLNLYQYARSNPILFFDPYGNLAVKYIGADAIFGELMGWGVSWSSPYLIGFGGSGGAQYLINCRSLEESAYVYGSFNIVFSTPGLTAFARNGIGFVWNLPNNRTYTKDFYSIGGAYSYGLGVYVEGFTSDPIDFLFGDKKEPMGFEVGFQWGLGGNITISAQWFWQVMGPNRLSSGDSIVKKLCDQCASGGQIMPDKFPGGLSDYLKYTKSVLLNRMKQSESLYRSEIEQMGTNAMAKYMLSLPRWHPYNFVLDSMIGQPPSTLQMEWSKESDGIREVQNRYGSGIIEN